MNANNNTYFNTLDENFETALELVSKTMSDEELYELLKNGNIPEKQIAALKIKNVTSKAQAEILVENLTGQDGKIREAVSLRINEFISDPRCINYFEDINAYDIFLEAIIDINGNICRNIINAVSHLKNNPEFTKYFLNKLINKIWTLIDVIKDFDLQDGKYKVNKEVFKLYWCMETLFEFAVFTNLEELKKILLVTAKINDYTIREKTAKILTLKFEDAELETLRLTLKQDNNYYVRRF